MVEYCGHAKSKSPVRDVYARPRNHLNTSSWNSICLYVSISVCTSIASHQAAGYYLCSPFGSYSVICERSVHTKIIWRVLTMIHNIQNYWVSGLCPSSGILNTKNHNVSGTGSVSVIRCFPLFTWERKLIQFPKRWVFFYLEFRTMDKVKKASNSEKKWFFMVSTQT
jgi:hypothetical protein